MKWTRLLLPCLLYATSVSSQVPTGAWPQWGGPTRDFKAPAVKLAASWPAAGPKALWSRDLGDGYSAIVTDGGALYTMYRPPKGMWGSFVAKVTGGEPEAVIALDPATGKTRWEHVYETSIKKGMDMQYGPGPHVTPLVAGDLVFTASTTGRLMALEKSTGKERWAQELWEALGGTVQSRGYSCSPLAYGENVLVTVGGKGQGVVAFRQKDGQVAWKGADLEVSPSSLMVINLDGQDQLLMFHANGIAGLDPRNGAVLWDHPHKTDWGLNIALPIWGDDHLLFVSSAYSGGSRVLQLTRAGDKTQVKELWFDNRLRIHTATPAHRRLRLRVERGLRPLHAGRDERAHRRDGVAGARAGQGDRGAGRRQGRLAGRGGHAGPGHAVTAEARDPLEGDHLQRPVLDGAHAGGHAALPARPHGDQGVRHRLGEDNQKECT